MTLAEDLIKLLYLFNEKIRLLTFSDGVFKQMLELHKFKKKFPNQDSQSFTKHSFHFIVKLKNK